MNTHMALQRIQRQAVAGEIHYTLHAQQEMVEEDFGRRDVLQAIASGQVLEDYPEHQRGACCLLYGMTDDGRHTHIVCTTAQPVLIIITVYEPLPPKWITPTERRPK